MKDLIIQALNEAYALFEKRIPETKKDCIYVEIGDIEPQDITVFMNENSVPENAWFACDAYNNACLCYEVDVPTSDKEKLRFKRDKFTGVAWNHVYKAMTTNGYKRVGFNTVLLQGFDDTTVYDMYINKEFDRLCEYYSLAFTKIK